MLTSNSPSVPQPIPDAWKVLEFPLSLTEIQKLSWLQMKMAAIVHMDDRHEPIDFVLARRLAFIKYLYVTHRISERVGVAA